MLNIYRRVLSLGLLVVGAMLVIWASMPARRQVVTATLSPGAMQLKSNNTDETQGILKDRLVRLEWPGTLRIGDEYQMVLEFTPFQGDAPSSDPYEQLIDIYASHNVMAEARYEVVGVGVDPANPSRESLPPGQGVKFKWILHADRAGWYAGKVWLSLRYLPMNGDTLSQVPIFIQPVRLHASSFLGIGAPAARLIGGSGLLLALGLLFNDMIYFIRKIIKPTTMDTKDSTVSQ